jgi:DNA repair protein RecN (Recombination protein N)
MQFSMLKRLSVRGFALLSDVAMELGPGLNVLTGETGAGKSLVLGALAALVGRGLPSGLLGPSCDAEIALDVAGEPGARALLRIQKEKPKSFLDGKSVPIGELRRKVAGELILTAQGAIRELASPSGVLELMDQRAGTGPLLNEYRAARREVARSTRELEALGAELGAKRAREGRVGEWLEELAKLAPAPGEYAALGARIELVSRRTQYLELCGRVISVIAERDVSVESELRNLIASVRRCPAPAFAAIGESLAEALAALGTAASRAGSAAEELASESLGLDELEQRRDAFERMAKRLGCEPASLDSAAAELERERARLEAIEQRLQDLEQVRTVAEAQARELGERLHARRQAAVPPLVKELARELAWLSLEGASLNLVLERRADALGPDGPSTLRIGFSANPGQPPGPLERVASGGERSRFALALACAGAAPGRTLIFDEIDQGVGGEALARLAERLSLLSRARQVVCVTHQAAIAARAERHFRVEKSVERGRTITRLTALDEEARTLELSRMLAGGRASEGARVLARRLRDEARSAA